MSWRAAKSLLKLQSQVNSAYPNRSKISDGLRGDQAHSSRVSQHNPNPSGVVTAMDITHDPKNGADMNKLKEKIIKDPRTWYVIFNRKIWQNGKWTNYTGANPHDKHLHISVKQTAVQYDNAENWTIDGNIDDMYKATFAGQIRNWTAKQWSQSAVKWYSEAQKNKESSQKATRIAESRSKEITKLKEQLKNCGNPTSNDEQVKQSYLQRIIEKVKGVK